MLRLATSFCIFSLLLSCELINTTEIEITTYPSERNQIVLEDSTLWIDFSESLIQNEAEGFLQIQGSTGTIEGDLSWIDQRLQYSPYESLITGFRYNFIYQGVVNTPDGRKYQLNINIPFYAGTDSKQAVLFSYSPESGSITDVFEPLIFGFSRNMDTNSFEQNFSVNPSADLDFLWEDNNSQVTVTPKQKWSNQKLHRWKIAMDLQDQSGIPIAMEYSQIFLVQEDVLPPEILSLQPTIKQADGSYLPLPALVLSDMQNSNDIYIQFNDSVDFASLNSSFYTKPDLNGHLKQISPQEFVYIKGSDFIPGDEYTVTFKEGLQDISGNEIPEDIVYTFTPDVPAINVLSIDIVHNSGNFLVDGVDLNSSDLVKINPYQYFGVYPGFSLQFTITLDQIFTVEEVTARQNFIQGISCEAIFPVGVSSPVQYVSSWNPSGNILSVQFTDFAEASDSEPVYYLFKISGGGSSSANFAGSYLLDDVYFYFNAQGMNP